MGDSMDNLIAEKDQLEEIRAEVALIRHQLRSATGEQGSLSRKVRAQRKALHYLQVKGHPVPKVGKTNHGTEEPFEIEWAGQTWIPKARYDQAVARQEASRVEYQRFWEMESAVKSLLRVWDKGNSSGLVAAIRSLRSCYERGRK